MNNNKHWVDYLPHNAHIRLAQCQTTKVDLPILLDAKWRWAQDTGRTEKGYTKDDCLWDIVETLKLFGLNDVAQAGEEWYFT